MDILGFSELIREIESELKQQYVGAAIKWADDHLDGAWSKALNRFDMALSVAIEKSDFRLARIEGDFYKATILDLLRKFKTAKNIDDTESFLKSLEDPK